METYQNAHRELPENRGSRNLIFFLPSYLVDVWVVNWQMDIGELMATTQSANAFKEGYGPDAYAGNAHLNDFSESQTERSYAAGK